MVLEDKITIFFIRDSSDSDPVIDMLHSCHYMVVSLDRKGNLADTVRQQSPDLVMIDAVHAVSFDPSIITGIKKNGGVFYIPIVVITSREDEDIRRKALEAGADDFLLHPVDPVELEARVSNLLKIGVFTSGIETEVTRRMEELTLAFEKVKIASLDTVYRLSRAAEYRDDDVGAHIERMSHYATAIARAMGLDETFVENILWAAPMHDVGKIGIPDSVLLKPGKLDDDEWVIMRKHPAIGSEILKDSSTDFIRMAEEIALSHHEKWDGNGYPYGLKGEDIPLSGRIVALADVFDALTTERPYKRAFTIKESMDIIRESSGSHFDPEVTKAFFSIESEIVKELNFWQFMEADPDPDGDDLDLSDLFSEPE